MAEQMTEKPFWKSNKVMVGVLVVIMVLGTILPLAILGKLSITSEQIFNFGEWLFMIFVGGHSVQRVATTLKAPAASLAAATLVTANDKPPASTTRSEE